MREKAVPKKQTTPQYYKVHHITPWREWRNASSSVSPAQVGPEDGEADFEEEHRRPSPGFLHETRRYYQQIAENFGCENNRFFQNNALRGDHSKTDFAKDVENEMMSIAKIVKAENMENFLQKIKNRVSNIKRREAERGSRTEPLRTQDSQEPGAVATREPETQISNRKRPAVDQDDTVQPKRGPGRPKNVQKRRRGRPPKVPKVAPHCLSNSESVQDVQMPTSSAIPQTSQSPSTSNNVPAPTSNKGKKRGRKPKHRRERLSKVQNSQVPSSFTNPSTSGTLSTPVIASNQPRDLQKTQKEDELFTSNLVEEMKRLFQKNCDEGNISQNEIIADSFKFILNQLKHSNTTNMLEFFEDICEDLSCLS